MWLVLEELITDDICTVYSNSAPFIPMSPFPVWSIASPSDPSARTSTRTTS
ncbi:MAG: hypothetical protein E7J58_01800 [Bacillota bacterium]|nr:hypothetical protein [Bacillota bacterium]